MQSRKIKKGRQLQFNRLQCNHEQIKKRDNSNLIDCNAITNFLKKGRQLQFNRLQCHHKKKSKKGGNPNLIDCNAIAQNKKREATPI